MEQMKEMNDKSDMNHWRLIPMDLIPQDPNILQPHQKSKIHWDNYAFFAKATFFLHFLHVLLELLLKTMVKPINISSIFKIQMTIAIHIRTLLRVTLKRWQCVLPKCLLEVFHNIIQHCALVHWAGVQFCGCVSKHNTFCSLYWNGFSLQTQRIFE